MRATRDLESDREFWRTRNISSLLAFPPTLPPYHPRLRFGTMEALSVDFGRLKSGEVNLGVCFPDIATKIQRLIGDWSII